MRLSVAQTLIVERFAESLSSTFHCRLAGLLSGRVMIGSVHPRPLFLGCALATLAGLSLVVSVCSGSTGNHLTQLAATTPTTNAERMRAFSRCVREHGVTNYPDPDPDPDGNGHLPASGKQIARSSPQFPAAEGACMHILQSGGATETQGDKQKLAFALKVARCMRSGGFPNYPDPTTSSASSQGSGTRFEGTGINTKSPRFQTTEMACEKQVRRALGLP
jgi:hypothetical protein